ncbi:hypothetical protein ACU21_02075 [Actinobaculum suis]|nr:hypothetical protein ACU19_03330 [Actinobaculum suis]OCA95995.1 hypothetical protein ACU20_02920 [Actinobaculum suis]OCA96223.1 hypothetical protein ACU21_02075 [Actinobaculum suis]
MWDAFATNRQCATSAGGENLRAAAAADRGNSCNQDPKSYTTGQPSQIVYGIQSLGAVIRA